MGVSSNALRCHHQAWISDEEESSRDAEDADEVEVADTDDDADDDDAAPDDNNYATKLPKVKPQPSPLFSGPPFWGIPHSPGTPFCFFGE